jgi:hypothetical protein
MKTEEKNAIGEQLDKFVSIVTLIHKSPNNSIEEKILEILVLFIKISVRIFKEFLFKE